jgi:hypothetical protein
MNKRGFVNSALLLGTSGALLWIMAEVVFHGRILLGEPNILILTLEVLLLSSIVILAIISLAIEARNALRRR